MNMNIIMIVYMNFYRTILKDVGKHVMGITCSVPDECAVGFKNPWSGSGRVSSY